MLQCHTALHYNQKGTAAAGWAVTFSRFLVCRSSLSVGGAVLNG